MRPHQRLKTKFLAAHIYETKDDDGMLLEDYVKVYGEYNGRSMTTMTTMTTIVLVMIMMAR